MEIGMGEVHLWCEQYFSSSENKVKQDKKIVSCPGFEPMTSHHCLTGVHYCKDHFHFHFLTL